MEHTACCFNYCAIGSFRNSVLLRCVRGAGLMSDTFLVEPLLKFIVAVLATVVRSECLEEVASFTTE